MTVMMDFDSAKNLMRSLHDRLSQDLGVQAILGVPPRLYDHLPEDPVFPYLTYGAMRSADIGGDDTGLISHSLNLHIWSRYSGRSEGVDLLAALGRALNTERLIIQHGSVISVTIVYTDIFRAPDARTLHGILRLNITTQSDLETPS